MKNMLNILLLNLLIVLCYGNNLNRIQGSISNDTTINLEQNIIDNPIKRQIFSNNPACAFQPGSLYNGCVPPIPAPLPSPIPAPPALGAHLLPRPLVSSGRLVPQALPGGHCEPGVECTGGSICSLGICLCPPELVQEGTVCVSRTIYGVLPPPPPKPPLVAPAAFPVEPPLAAVKPIPAAVRPLPASIGVPPAVVGQPVAVVRPPLTVVGPQPAAVEISHTYIPSPPAIAPPTAYLPPPPPPPPPHAFAPAPVAFGSPPALPLFSTVVLSKYSPAFASPLQTYSSLPVRSYQLLPVAPPPPPATLISRQCEPGDCLPGGFCNAGFCNCEPGFTIGIEGSCVRNGFKHTLPLEVTESEE